MLLAGPQIYLGGQVAGWPFARLKAALGAARRAVDFLLVALVQSFMLAQVGCFVVLLHRRADSLRTRLK